MVYILPLLVNHSFSKTPLVHTRVIEWYSTQLLAFQGFSTVVGVTTLLPISEPVYHNNPEGSYQFQESHKIVFKSVVH